MDDQRTVARRGRSDRLPPTDRLLPGAALALRNADAWMRESDVLYAQQGNPGHVVALTNFALEEAAKAFLWILAVTETDVAARSGLLGRTAREHHYRLEVALSLAVAVRARPNLQVGMVAAASESAAAPRPMGPLLDYFAQRLDQERRRTGNRQATELQMVGGDARYLGVIRASTIHVDRRGDEFVTPEAAVSAFGDRLEALLADAHDVLTLVERFRLGWLAASGDDQRRMRTLLQRASQLWPNAPEAPPAVPRD